MPPQVFFKNRRWIAITTQVLLLPVLLLLPLVTVFWLIAGHANPAVPIAKALLSNSEFRGSVADSFVAKVSKSATGEEKRVVSQNSKKISTSINELLAQPDFITAINEISTTAFDFYVGGSKEVTTIDLKPIATLGLIALKQVDPQFKALEKEIGKLKPIELKPQTSGPDVHKIHSILDLSFYGLWFLAITLNLLFFAYTRSRKSGLRFFGWEFLWLAFISLAIKIAGSLFESNFVNKNSDLVAKIAIPIVGNKLLSYFLITGLVYGVCSIVFLTSSFIPKLNRQASLKVI